MCPDDHRRRVWRHPGQCADPAFTIALHTCPQTGVMVWGVISFDSRTPLVIIRGILTPQRCGLSSLHSEHADQFWNQESFLSKRAILHQRNGVVQWCSLGGNGYLTLSILKSGENQTAN
ncbi:transposable element Tc1 transposase [Trichonephila clavipes]|nr:transposable element Tc1 transposase [Trichonephila clavipes]